MTRSPRHTDSRAATHGSAPTARGIDVHRRWDRDRPPLVPGFSGPAAGLLLLCDSPPTTVGLAYCDDGIALYQLPEPEHRRQPPERAVVGSARSDARLQASPGVKKPVPTLVEMTMDAPVAPADNDDPDRWPPVPPGAGPPSPDDGGTSCLAACAAMYPQGAQTFQQGELNACGCAQGQPCAAACSAACASACTSSTCNACLNAQVAERLSSSCTSTALDACIQDSMCRPYAMCANSCP